MTEAQRMSVRASGEARAALAGAPATWRLAAVLALKDLAEWPGGTALGVIALAGLTWIGLSSRLLPDEAILAAVGFGAAGVLPVLAAMGVAAPERSAGTINLLRTLPISGAWAYSVKLVVALGAVLLPVAVSAVIALAIAGGREVATLQMLGMFGAIACLAVLHTIWIAGLSVGQRTEARVALVGVGFYIAFVVLGETLDWVCNDNQTLGWLLSWLPLSLVMSFRGIDAAFVARAMIATAAAAGVWAVAAWRFARPEKPR
jgi:hypothetical protein